MLSKVPELTKSPVIKQRDQFIGSLIIKKLELTKPSIIEY